jgi:CO/xanthine dehydrogenase FAD-binding subunit
MISEYHRPQTVEEALRLLARPDPRTVVLGGGLYLNQGPPSLDPVAVVDVQEMGLDTIESRGHTLTLGAAVTLRDYLDAEGVPPVIKAVIPKETGYNRRQVATFAGTLITADGRSPLAAVLMAFDPLLTLLRDGAEPEEIPLGDFLPLREEHLQGGLVTQITLSSRTKVAYEQVARTPVDRPIVCAAVGKWPSGRTRVILGGYGKSPRMVLDGTDQEGAAAAARDSYQDAEDEWSSAAYRSDVAAILVERCLQQVNAQ